MKHTDHIHNHNYVSHDDRVKNNERRTFFVVILTLVTMFFEVGFGYWTKSMALLADGWHMASHAGALGISLIAYRYAKHDRLVEKFSFGTGKFIPLGGYTSALFLGVVAIFMIIESVERLLNPLEINFNIAIYVSIIGLVVNIASALLLWDFHDHDDHHASDHVHDHNHQSALVHVITDALTSVLAIFALFLGKYFGWSWADPVMGIIGAIVIMKWAMKLIKNTAWELLDGNSLLIEKSDIESLFISEEGVIISDIHVWRIAPNAHACELMICSSQSRGSDYYREIVLSNFDISHLVIEERVCNGHIDEISSPV